MPTANEAKSSVLLDNLRCGVLVPNISTCASGSETFTPILLLPESTIKISLPAAFLNATDFVESLSGSTYILPVTKKSPSATESTSITCLSAYSVPEITTSPPKRVASVLVKSLFERVPDTNKKTSLPTLLNIAESEVLPSRLLATEPLYIAIPAVVPEILPVPIILLVSI